MFTLNNTQNYSEPINNLIMN